MAVQCIGPKYKFTADSSLLEGAKVMVEAGSNAYKFTMNPSGGGYGISVPASITSLAQLAADEPSYRAMFDLEGIKHHVFWCYTFANPNNWQWTNGFTNAEQAAEYNEIHALAVHLLTRYNNTGKSFYIGHWEGDWSVGVDSGDPANSNPTPTAIQGMIDWLNVRQKAVDDAMANTPHSNVDVYCYTEVNRVTDAYALGMDRVINRVVPNVPNLDFVSWSSYEIQHKSKGEILACLNYAESLLPTAKSARIPGKRIFIGEFGYGGVSEAGQVPLTMAYNQTLFEWGCPFAFYWTLYDNDPTDGSTFNLIDPNGVKTANYWLYQRFLNAAKMKLLAFKQGNGRLPTDPEFSVMASALLSKPLEAPVALAVSHLPPLVGSGQTATLGCAVAQGVYGADAARVFLCHGTSDGGTVPGNWQHVTDLGLATKAGVSEVTGQLTGLLPQTTYFFRCFASAAGDMVWAPESGRFRTLDVHTFTPVASGTFAWTGAGNWEPGGVPASGTTTGVAFFENTGTPLAGGTHTINTDPASFTMNALTLNGLGPTSGTGATVDIGTSGNTWTLDGPAPIVHLTGNRANQSLSITVHPDLVLAQDTTFHGNGTAGFTFGGSIRGAVAVTKSGAGSLTLSGANSFSGGLFVKEGTLTCTATGSFGAGTIHLGDTAGAANATLCGFSSSTTTSAPIVVRAGGTGVVTIRNPTAGSTNFLGNLTIQRDVTLDGGTAVSAFSVFKTGILSGTGNITVSSASNAATVVLQHPDSSGYTGSVTVQNGTLRLSHASALNAANEVRVGAGATLDVRNNVTIGGLSDRAGLGGLVINNGSAATRTLSLGGLGNCEFSGTISDGASAGRIVALVKSGNGSQILRGPGTYSGGTVVGGGVLEVDCVTALGIGGVTIDGEATQLLLGAGGTLANAITIAGGTGTGGQGLIDAANGVHAELGAERITIIGSPSVGNAGHFGSSSRGSLTVRGFIDSAVTVDWRRNNGVFHGGGNYVNFRIRSGTVKLGADNGLAPSATVNIGANSAGILDLAGHNQTLAGITKAGNAASVTNSGGVISTLTLTGTSSYGGVITDGVSPLAMVIDGGTLTLGGPANHTGGTTIRRGALALDSSGSLSGGGPIHLAAGARIDTTAVASFAFPASRTLTFGIDPAGPGSSGRIHADGLDIRGAAVLFDVAGPLDDAAYVLASYTSLTGTAFASVTPPAGYSIDYHYAGGTQIALVRGLASDANLLGLSLSAGSLSPGFAVDITSYAAAVSNATDSLIVTPTAADGSATIRVNGAIVASGSPSSAISLAVGTNVINTTVTAQDGRTSKTYTLEVTRAAISDTYTFTRTATGAIAWTDVANWDAAGVPASAATVAVVFYPDTTTALPGGTCTIQGDPAALILNTLALNGLGAAGTTASASVSLGTAGNVWTFDGTAPAVMLNGMKNTTKDLFYNVRPDLLLNRDLTVSGNGTAGGSASGFVFSGTIGGTGSLTKSGSSRLTLTGNNQYSGGTLLNGGQLWIGNGGALGTGAVIVSGAARQLTANGNAVVANDLTLSAGTGAGTSAQGLVDAAGFSLVLGGTIRITDTPQSGGHFGSNSGTLTVNGPVESSVPVTVRRGTVVFAGTGSSYNQLVVQSGRVKLGASDSLPTSASVDLGTHSGGATLDLAGFDQRLAGITKNAHPATITNSGTRDSTLALAGTSSFGGSIEDGATNKLALTVDGGALTLTAVNGYGGATTIRAGSLVLGASASISNSRRVVICPGAALDVTALASFAPPASQTVSFGIDAAGDGQCGRIDAAGLDVSGAVVEFEVSGVPDDPVYVLATYTSLTGTGFAVATPPEGYSIDYRHAGGTQIALVKQQSRYEVWAADNGIAGAAFAEDHDGDGFDNGTEYAIGTDPKAHTPGPPLVAEGSNYRLTYPKGASAAVDPAIDYAFELSQDLKVWTEVAPTTEEEASVSCLLEGGRGNVFVRLKIKTQ